MIKPLPRNSISHSPEGTRITMISSAAARPMLYHMHPSVPGNKASWKKEGPSCSATEVDLAVLPFKSVPPRPCLNPALTRFCLGWEHSDAWLVAGADNLTGEDNPTRSGPIWFQSGNSLPPLAVQRVVGRDPPHGGRAGAPSVTRHQARCSPGSRKVHARMRLFF